MALKLYNESDIQDIADAIRGKNGSSDTYTVSQMASAISAIPSGGGDPANPLPDGYTLYEYLESSGTQYIDTGLYTKANQKYYIDFKADNQQNVFGNNLTTGCGMFIQSNGVTIYYRFGSANYQNATINPVMSRTALMQLDGFYLKDYLQNIYVMAGQISSSTVTEDSSIHNILFGRTTGSSSRQLSKVKIYHFKCEEGDTVVRDMYPCMRDSDSVLGFYDVANDVFYTNAGTGTFTGGALS